MAFIFGHRKKSPPDLCKSTKKHIDILSDSKQQEEKTIKKVGQYTIHIHREMMREGRKENDV